MKRREFLTGASLLGAGFLGGLAVRPRNHEKITVDPNYSPSDKDALTLLEQMGNPSVDGQLVIGVNPEQNVVCVKADASFGSECDTVVLKEGEASIIKTDPIINFDQFQTLKPTPINP